MTHRLILTASALALLICTGVVHGLWTDRWSGQLDLGAAAQALERLSYTIKDWHGADLPIEKDPRSGLIGIVSRSYTHSTTGRTVTLFLACGRPGPVSTHTPDVCYQCQGFDGETPRRFQLPSQNALVPPEFWTARFLKQRNDGQIQLRIYWTWLAGQSWQAAENPRLAFAGERILHKMYVLREIAPGESAQDPDPCVDFIKDLLPELKNTLYTETRKSDG
jgi:hypothetical protein